MREEESISAEDVLESLVFTIEDKEKEVILPIGVYQCLIVVMYSQYSGYIVSTYTQRPLVDRSTIYLAHWYEYSPGTFLLFLTGNDTLTLLCFWIVQAILYGYLGYLVLLTYFRRRQALVTHRPSSLDRTF